MRDEVWHAALYGMIILADPWEGRSMRGPSGVLSSKCARAGHRRGLDGLGRSVRFKADLSWLGQLDDPVRAL